MDGISSSLNHAVSTLNYLNEIERLNRKPPLHISEHKGYRLDENQILDLPGIETNLFDGDAELWLQVRRLHPNRPPEPKGVLALWLSPSNAPAAKPEIQQDLVIDEKELWSEALARHLEEDRREDKLVYLKLEECPEVTTAFDNYIDNEWKKWSVAETPRRETIEFYDRLFGLYQEIETTGSDNPKEVIWGAGIALWNISNHSIQYPLITKQVEIELDSHTMSLNVRPTSSDSTIELGPYFALEVPGAQVTEQLAKTIIETSVESFSPFDLGPYESILHSAAGQLDKNGAYWPDKNPASIDRKLPSARDELIVTDTWTLFSRPRSTNSFADDIHKLLEGVRESEGITGAAETMLCGPSNEKKDRRKLNFRGVSSLGLGSPQEGGFPSSGGGQEIVNQRLKNCTSQSHSIKSR